MYSSAQNNHDHSTRKGAFCFVKIFSEYFKKTLDIVRTMWYNIITVRDKEIKNNGNRNSNMQMC